MIPMSELVRDRWYLQYLNENPRIDDKHKGIHFSSKAWTVYVQLEAHGPWRKREFDSYKKALKFLFLALKRGVHDAALNNKRTWSAPPDRIVRIKGQYRVNSRGKRQQVTKLIEWKPKLGDVINGVAILDMEEHEWCGYCRRPTVFRFYARHKVLGEVDPNVDRCSICGASRRIAPTPKRRRY